MTRLVLKKFGTNDNEDPLKMNNVIEQISCEYLALKLLLYNGKFT